MNVFLYRATEMHSLTNDLVVVADQRANNQQFDIAYLFVCIVMPQNLFLVCAAEMSELGEGGAL